MFETVAPDAFARRDRHVLYETLPASIAIHFAAAAVITVVAMSRIAFPLQPPKVIVGYIAAELGEPVPPPPPPPALKQPDVRPEPKLLAPMAVALTPMDVAPATIPDEVEQMPPPSSIRLVSATVDKLVPGRSNGVMGGVAGGLSGGVLGGDAGGVTGGIVGGDGRMHFERDSRLPLFAEEHPYPEYPDNCINQRLEGLVIVKYVIGKDGRVNDVTIIHHAAHNEFDASTVEAIRHWRFRPLIIDGEPMEVVHELTVFFRLY